MSSFDVLLYTPAIPTILRSLSRAPEGQDESELRLPASEQKHVAKALSALLEHGLVERNGEKLELTKECERLEKIRSLLQFYDDIHQKARIELTFRGILNATQYRCLVHLQTFMEMMNHEGFERSEVDEMLAREKSGGHVEHLRIVYRMRKGLEHRRFSFIPFYYYPQFLVMKDDNISHFKAKLESAGISATEEEYLLGNYPKEIANQSREYITTQKAHIKERIKNEAFDIWWYYRF